MMNYSRVGLYVDRKKREKHTGIKKNSLSDIINIFLIIILVIIIILYLI